MEILIRPAARDELPRVNELRRQVNDLHVQGRADIFRPGFVEELRQTLYDAFDRPDADVPVALLEGNIAGFALVEHVRRPESPYNLAREYLRVSEFCVDAAFRRRGVATALMDHIREEARRLGLDRVELDAWEFNRDALAFYESYGFQSCRRYYELPVD